MHRTRRLRRAAAAAAAIVTMAVAGSLLPLAGGAVGGAAAVAATAAQPLQLGVYTHPGAKGVAGARAFADWSGAPVSRVLDFLPSTSWLEMTRNAWLLTPYTGTGYQLELSVPMLPDSAGVSLAGCAAGAYDGYWTSIASSVVAAGLPTTAIRPGWEMNGAWYRWTAVGRAADYAGCWRRLVTAMRSVPGQRFTFTFNPNVGDNPMSAETAYPGDAYVDDVSVDVYDTSWNSYPTPSGMSTDDARASAWNYLLKGSHGLRFWAGFAAAHGKPLAVGEWGITWRSDGHGGGDDPDFVDRFFDWASDPANNVRYLNYFNCADSATLRHDLMRADTTFPRSAARFRARSAAVAAAQRAAAGGSGGSVPATAPTTAPTVTPTPTAPTVTPTPTAPKVTPTPTAPGGHPDADRSDGHPDADRSDGHPDGHAASDPGRADDQADHAADHQRPPGSPGRRPPAGAHREEPAPRHLVGLGGALAARAVGPPLRLAARREGDPSSHPVDVPGHPSRRRPPAAGAGGGEPARLPPRPLRHPRDTGRAPLTRRAVRPGPRIDASTHRRIGASAPGGSQSIGVRCLRCGVQTSQSPVSLPRSLAGTLATRL